MNKEKFVNCMATLNRIISYSCVIVLNFSYETITSISYFPLSFTSSKILHNVRKMDPRPIYFGFWCLMTNTTKLD